MGGGATTQCTVTKTNYPEVSLVLKGQKATAYDPASKVWTFAESETVFNSTEKEAKKDFVFASTSNSLIGSSIAYAGETYGTYFYMALNGDLFAIMDGKVVDVSANGNLSFVNASGFSDGTKAVALSGNSQWIDIPVDTQVARGNFTFFARYYQTSNNRVAYIAATQDCFIGIDNNGDVYSMWAGNSGWNIIESDSDSGRSSVRYKTNQWVSLAYIHDASANKYLMYVNGDLAKTINSSGLIGSGQRIRIGAWGNNGYCFSGQIRDVRIYDRVLSASELKSMA
jgi:hypothetical protein